MLAMMLYWIHCRAFDAEYSVNIASTAHRRLYTLKSPATPFIHCRKKEQEKGKKAYYISEIESKKVTQ